MRSRRRVLSIATLGVFRSRMILIDECDLVSILDRVFDSLSTMDLIEETKPISTVAMPTEFDMANVLLQLRELKEDQEQLRRAAPPVPVASYIIMGHAGLEKDLADDFFAKNFVKWASKVADFLWTLVS